MSIPESRVEAILSNILGEDYEVKLGKSRVEDLLIGIAGVIANTPQLDNDGLIPISYIPKDAFQDCVTVQDDTARFALTTDDVQNGDCVYVNSSQIMYFVIDDTKLDQAAGYKALAAGIAAQAVADKDGNDITTTYLKSEEYNAGKTVSSSTHAEIFNNYTDNQATNSYAHAEGSNTKAWGAYSHAEGYFTKATNQCCHAEGQNTVASAAYAHAEGSNTKAWGAYSHAEGYACYAYGNSSHAEGDTTVANASKSHAEGEGTKAMSTFQHVEGKYNVEDSNDKFAHIIGNGTANNARSNAFAVGWDGKIYTHNSATGFDIQSNYIEFPNGQRLYNSSTAPTGNIPDGSIGIGW